MATLILNVWEQVRAASERVHGRPDAESFVVVTIGPLSVTLGRAEATELVDAIRSALNQGAAVPEPAD